MIKESQFMKRRVTYIGLAVLIVLCVVLCCIPVWADNVDPDSELLNKIAASVTDLADGGQGLTGFISMILSGLAALLSISLLVLLIVIPMINKKSEAEKEAQRKQVEEQAKEEQDAAEQEYKDNLILKIDDLMKTCEIINDKIQDIELMLAVGPKKGASEKIEEENEDEDNAQKPPDNPVAWFNWWLEKHRATGQYLDLHKELMCWDIEVSAITMPVNYQESTISEASYIVYQKRDQTRLYVFPNPRRFRNLRTKYQNLFDFNPNEIYDLTNVPDPAIMDRNGGDWIFAKKGRIE